LLNIGGAFLKGLVSLWVAFANVCLVVVRGALGLVVVTGWEGSMEAGMGSMVETLVLPSIEEEEVDFAILWL
jgi:hypothetical protein